MSRVVGNKLQFVDMRSASGGEFHTRLVFTSMVVDYDVQSGENNWVRDFHRSNRLDDTIVKKTNAT